MSEAEKQQWLEEFIKRAGWDIGWSNLEYWAQRMAEQAYRELVDDGRPWLQG